MLILQRESLDSEGAKTIWERRRIELSLRQPMLQSMIKILLGFRGKKHAWHGICVEQESSPDFEKHNSRRSLHRNEAWYWTLQFIWVPNVFSCTQREEVQAISFRKKGYNESSKTSLVRDRMRQVETLSLKKRQFFKDPKNLRWRLTMRQYLLPLQQFRGRQTLL